MFWLALRKQRGHDFEEADAQEEAVHLCIVVIEDEELEAVRLDTVRTIDIDAFVPRDSIPWVYLDSPHYLVPDDEVGEEAFSVIRDAMAAAKMVGISRVVLYRRERAVMLEPRDRGIILWTLRYGDEVRDAEDYFSGIGREKSEPEQLTLMKKYIKARTRRWDASPVEDPVQENLLEMIEAKKKKRKSRPAKPKAEELPSNVINIMDALKASLAKGRKKEDVIVVCLSGRGDKDAAEIRRLKGMT